MAERLPNVALKEKALSLGFQSVGVCDAVPSPHLDAYASWLGKGYHGSMGYLAEQLGLKADPANLLPEARSVIAVALNYYQPAQSGSGQPRIARYAFGRDYHKVLRAKLRKLAAWVEEQHPCATTRACVDSAPIFERDYANLAGLGFFGKNTMLIDARRGSWFFIGLLLTTLPFEADQPFEGGCGTCTKCIDACPTGALVQEDGRWQLNASRCISYLTIEHAGDIDQEFHAAMGDWTFGCDICQEVCPFNEPRSRQPERCRPTEEPDFVAQREWHSLRDLAEIPLESWDQMTAGSPLRRAGHEGLKRNARINLSNAGRPSGPDTQHPIP
ncbi:MAG: epoxyqueuosine reductase [Fimbriimonadaceae bacterium]|jgi:epoxyqueuosine reductase|nr:epoxyqueuosine reductase [Fimbriimonadaceae bacterium]